MVINITGFSNSGKTTLAKAIQKKDESYQLKSWAYKMKKFLADLLEIDVELLEDQEYKKLPMPNSWISYTAYNKETGEIVLEGILESEVESYVKHTELLLKKVHPTIRQALQQLGTEVLKNKFHRLTHVNGLIAEYLKNPHNSNWVITDSRFPEEFKAVRKSMDLHNKTVVVHRPGTVEVLWKGRSVFLQELKDSPTIGVHFKTTEGPIKTSDLKIEMFIDPRYHHSSELNWFKNLDENTIIFNLCRESDTDLAVHCLLSM